MKKLSLPLLAVLALAGTATARDSNVRWMKFDEAMARAATNGQPIAVFVAVNPNGSSWSSGNCTQTERSFGNETLAKYNSNFYMVRCADKATSDKIKSTEISTMIFFDGDGKEYHRTAVSSPDSVEAAYRKALEMYAKRPISWASGDASTVASQVRDDKKKLVALAFLDEKKECESLVNAIEDRWNAKHHDRLVFVKVAYDRNSEECKKWGVTAAPTLLLINPAEENPKKSIIDQLVSKKEVSSVRAFLLKAFEKLDRASKK